MTEAMRQPDAHLWKEVMAEEELWCYKDTWEVVDWVFGMNILSNKWVFKRKRDAEGAVTRHRARLVVRGFGQNEGVDYGAIFAPVVRYSTIRLLLALCAHYGMYKCHLDAPKAFTQADLLMTMSLAPKALMMSVTMKTVITAMKTTLAPTPLLLRRLNMLRPPLVANCRSLSLLCGTFCS